MKNIFKILLIGIVLLGYQTGCMAVDTLHTKYSSISGKFDTISGGLIVIKEEGTYHSYTRAVKNDYYGDHISYRKGFFSKKEIVDIPCKVIFLDKWTVIYQVPDANSVKIPRLVIQDLEIKI